MKSIKNITITMLLAAMLLALGASQASAEKFKVYDDNGNPSYRYGGVWLTIIRDIPDTVQVGTVYKVKFKYTNRFRNKQNKLEGVRFKPWPNWGSYSFPSKSDRINFLKYWTTKKKSLKASTLKPYQSRLVTYKVTYKTCLPPWGQDWGGQPGDYFYWGLPCASGQFVLSSLGRSKSSNWVEDGFSYPYKKGVLIVPASGQSATSTPTGPTGSSSPTGPTG